jgi:hypothetical protein
MFVEFKILLNADLFNLGQKQNNYIICVLSVKAERE